MANPRKRYLLIPFLYVGVILLLLALALFARGFSIPVGEARLGGRYAPLPLFGSHEASEATLSYHGLSLRFSRRRPLRIDDRSRGLLAVERYAAGADIVFEGDIRLRLAAVDRSAPGGSAADGSLSLSLLVPPQAGDAIQLEIPFRLRGTWKQTENAPVLSWERGGASFLLTLPSGSRIDSARGSISLAGRATGGSLELRFARAAGATQSPYAAWLSQEASRVGPEELKQVLARYQDAAYKGWSETRLAAGSGLWKMPNGKEAFDERIGDGLLAESIPRGTYPRLRGVYADALAQVLSGASGSSLSLSASAYVGNLREYTRRLAAGEASRIERIRGLLARSDAALLDTSGLVPLLLDHGPSSLVPEVRAFAESRDVSALGLPESLGLLETLMDYASIVEKSDAGSQKCKEAIERKLLPSIKKTDSGIFLESASAGRIDVLQSLRCGSLLLRAGTLLDMPLAASVGRALLASALELAGDAGFLPGSAVLSATRLSSEEGTLAPEEIYALLPLDLPRPGEKPLYRELGPGCWIWTAARLDRADATPAGATIALAFPIGLPHYTAIQGIKPFSELKLHGIPWRPAADYAQYSDGWLYDAQTQTLYLKLTNRAETEEIVIAY